VRRAGNIAPIERRIWIEEQSSTPVPNVNFGARSKDVPMPGVAYLIVGGRVGGRVPRELAVPTRYLGAYCRVTPYLWLVKQRLGLLSDQ
jgi:hypothetical protein